MHPGLLVLSMAGGVLWADRGQFLPVYLLVPWLLFAVAMLCAMLCPLRPPRRQKEAPIHRSHAARGLIVMGMLAAFGVAFIAGFDRLDVARSRAGRDVERAQRALGEGMRVAEARVASRRPGRWGDEIELVNVLAVDGRLPLPVSLSLRLGALATQSIDGRSSRADRLLWPGAWVRVGLHVAPNRAARNPGNADRAQALARYGRAARARLVKSDWVMALLRDRSGRVGPLDRLAYARRVWRRRVGERLEGEGHAGAIVGALGLGDRTGIAPETRDAFRRLGLSHLLAVSGLHVGFVAGLAGWLVLRAGSWMLGPGTRLWIFDATLGVACSAAAFYAWTTGGGVSVERAALLFGLYAVCRLSSRSLTPTAALSWVALGVLWMEPAALFHVGAQLSFGACATLILGGFWNADAPDGARSRPEKGLLHRLVAIGHETFRASLAISLGTAPLLVQAGLPLALLAPVVNVIAIPCLGILVLPASLLAVFLSGALPDTAFSALMFPAQIFGASAVRVATILPETPALAPVSFLILVLACVMGLRWIRRRRWGLGLGVWLAVALLGANPFPDGRIVEDPPRVVFFDMGQGDASLVQGREAVMLIDTGPGPPDDSGGRGLVRGLRAMGVATIDVLVVTHGDLDHRGGARRILGSFRVNELWLPSPGQEDEPLIALAAAAWRGGTRVRWLSRGVPPIHRGDLAIDVLWPPAGALWSARSRNENSLVLRVVLDEVAYLFTADIGGVVEGTLMNRPGAIAADVLKVGHHGSRSSSSRAFLDAVGATVTVVSAPCDSSRGLPSPSTLARLRETRAALWWTGRDGAVIAVGSQDGRIAVESWGKRRRCERS